jgi:hypothetical protein
MPYRALTVKVPKRVCEKTGFGFYQNFAILLRRPDNNFVKIDRTPRLAIARCSTRRWFHSVVIREQITAADFAGCLFGPPEIKRKVHSNW